MVSEDEFVGMALRAAKTARAAIAKWGAENQMRQLQEECGELVAVVNQYARGRVGVDEVASEVADVVIMCSQMRQLLGPVVDAHVQLKLERLERRIAESP